MNKVLGHLKTVHMHRKYVRKFCFMCGLYYQGLVHDLSKYSPTEFGESIKYYTGTRSPIDVCKEKNDYSEAWFHHRGRNKHHYEYWYDRFDNGGYACKMPWKYVLEMVCDYLGAGAAYSGGIKKLSMESELKWWKDKAKIAAIHPETKKVIDVIFHHMIKFGIKETLTSETYLKVVKDRYESGYYKGKDILPLLEIGK